MIDILIFLFVVAVVVSLAVYAFDHGFKAGCFETEMNNFFELEDLEARIAQLQRRLKEQGEIRETA